MTGEPTTAYPGFGNYGQADAAPEPEHVLHTVREDHSADGESQQDQAEVGAAVPGQLAALRAVQRLGGRPAEAGSRRGTDRPGPAVEQRGRLVTHGSPLAGLMLAA